MALGSEELPHKDEGQVELDVRRSYAFLFTTESKDNQQGWSAADVCALRAGLSKVIVRVLRAHRSLNYYQGYHDIASIIVLECSGHQNVDHESILVTEHEKAYAILESLSVNHLRDFMTPTITPLINHLRLIAATLEKADPAFFDLIRRLSSSYLMSEGAFYDYTLLQALSSLLTFYSHEVLDLERLLLIWDRFMECQSVAFLINVYVSALIERKEDIISSLESGSAENSDTDTLHTLLSPKYIFEGLLSTRFNEILERASRLLGLFPIDTLGSSGSTVEMWLEQFCDASVLMNTSMFKTINDNEDALDGDDTDEDPSDLKALMERQHCHANEQEKHDTAALMNAMRGPPLHPTRDSSLSSLVRLIGFLNKLLKTRPITYAGKHSNALPMSYKIGVMIGVAAFAAAYFMPRISALPIRHLLGGIVRANRRVFSEFERGLRDFTN